MFDPLICAIVRTCGNVGGGGGRYLARHYIARLLSEDQILPNLDRLVLFGAGMFQTQALQEGVYLAWNCIMILQSVTS